MASTVARTLLIVAVLLAAVGCGYDLGATFNPDGTVDVGLKLLLPKSLLSGGQGTTVSGFSPADIQKANTELAAKYPGAKVAAVTEGDEEGVAMTIPFKTENDAFAFLTQPSTLNPSSAASGTGGIDVGNTGGIFASATHTTSGQTDTYTFKSQAAPAPSPSPGSTSPVTADELASIITITFSLTVPHEITSAPGALFTLDRKTAIWKLSLTQAQTLTATTDQSVVLAGATSTKGSAQTMAILIGLGLAGIALGFFVGLITPWKLRHRPAVAPAGAPAPAPAEFAATPWGEPATVQSLPKEHAPAWLGPPPDAPPPNPPSA